MSLSQLHKVVLAGVSPEMSARVADCIEPELRLLLPPDITQDNLMTFVSYLYHGRITLNIDNVQQLYRQVQSNLDHSQLWALFKAQRTKVQKCHRLQRHSRLRSCEIL